MSRSRRKTPVRGITSASTEKGDKTRSHRLMRRKASQNLIQNDPDEATPPEKNFEALNPWAMAKDGKYRFDPIECPSFMRK
jgi:hypothetical protein